MSNRQRHIACGLLGALMSAHAAASAATNALVSVIARYEMKPLSLAALSPSNAPVFDLATAQSNGLRHVDLPSLGSGLDRNVAGEWFGLTDRGPNSLLATAAGGGRRRLLPLPDFAPGIGRFGLSDGKITLEEFIPLRDPQGRPLTGRSITAAGEPCFATLAAVTPLPPDPDGVDPEGLRCRPGGGFLVSEEYAPSLLLVDAAGRVQSRLVPRGLSLPGARCQVSAILPEIFLQRRVNRGFECLALSPDGRTAVALLQSPVGDADKKRFAASRFIRAVQLDLADPAQPRVTKHFLVPAGQPAEHPGTKLQDSVKFNDAVWLAPGRLLVLEQAKKTAVLRLVDFNSATNLMGRVDENDLVLDAAATDLAARGIRPAESRVVCRLDEISAAAGHKLEGLCVLGADSVAVANDNDFGIGENEAGLPTRVWFLKLPEPLPLAVSAPH